MDICRFYLLGGCKFKDSCILEHCDLPYQWQVKDNDEWTSIDFETNKYLETTYCQPQMNDILVRIKYVPT